MENFMLTSMFMGAFAKLSTGDARLDAALQMAAGALALALGNTQLRMRVWYWILRRFAPHAGKNSVALEYSHALPCPAPYGAVMHFIEVHGCGVRALKSLPPDSAASAGVESRYDGDGSSSKDPYRSRGLYSVAQTSRIALTADISGTYSSRRVLDAGKDVCVDSLVLSSDALSLQDILAFVRECEFAREEHRKGMLRSQSIVDVSWNANRNPYNLRENDIMVVASPWSSCASFENRFFDSKREILDKIEFFCENRAWYARKGIPHTLGILLWGEPGCGKTSFIKALGNHALFRDKHIVNIRLSKDFDLDVLGRILCSAYITPGVFVPLDKRILVFEDIDCMCEVVADRRAAKPAEAAEAKPAEPVKVEKTSKHKNTNSLNTLLNILDGLDEASERVIIMTSNHPERLDRALVRPGRIDINVHFQKTSCGEIEDIVRHYWDLAAGAPLPARVPEACARTLSAADVVNACRSSASASAACRLIVARAAEAVADAAKIKAV